MMGNPAKQEHISNLNYAVKTQAAETALHSHQVAQYVAIVSAANGGVPTQITLNNTRYNVTACVSVMAGLIPRAKLGDAVLVSVVAGEEGVLIHGVLSPINIAKHASLDMVDGKLVIESVGAVILKSGTSTIELNEAGEIQINGTSVRTVAETVRTEGQNITTYAKQALRFLGSKINLN